MTNNTSGFKFIDRIHPEALLKEALDILRRGASLNKTYVKLAKKYGTTDNDIYLRLKMFREEMNAAVEKTRKEQMITENPVVVKQRERLDDLDSIIKYLERNKSTLVESDETEILELEKELGSLQSTLSEMETLLEANRPLEHLRQEVQELRVTYNTLEKLGLLEANERSSTRV